MAQYPSSRIIKRRITTNFGLGVVLAVVFFLGLSMTQGKLFGAENDLHLLLKEKIKASYPEAVQIRRMLHQIPEPCFKESKTAVLVADYLRRWGLEVQTGIAGTGIKAILRGKQVKPVVGIRADMDALPITETTGLPYQSQNSGFMHACGHDGHITNLLITAKILSEIKEQIPGTIVFLFQPCEEGAPEDVLGGAASMIAAGALDNPKIDIMLGMHVMPGEPGTVSLREGPLMASVASVYLSIKGKSSHGAFPHQGIDAIYAAALAIEQFQALISRSKDPNQPAVLTIGKINGGVRLNVIAEKVDMEGTVRTFSDDTERKIEQGMENILKGLQVSMGITYDFKFSRSSPFVDNDPALTQRVIPLFQEILGVSNVHIVEPVTISEDFSFYSRRVPSLFFFLGAGENRALHTPTFVVEEDIFQYGPLLLAAAALDYLNCKQ